MSDETTSTVNPESSPAGPNKAGPKLVGYCRACGKALDESSVRSAQGSIYCAEHAPAASTWQQQGPPRTGFAEPRYDSPYSSSAPPLRPQSEANPLAAFWLGLIPGLGAIYNGQYVKGFVHVGIFGLLISLANHGGPLEPMFGLMIPAFVFYMAFEAHHTARNRRDGFPIDEFSGLVAGPEATRFPIAPVLLIVFGVLFLLDSLEILELQYLMRFWPVLMIGLGAYLLYVRTLGLRGPDDFPRESNAPSEAPHAKAAVPRAKDTTSHGTENGNEGGQS